MKGIGLSGGSGTRLWPASRRALPKQLLALARDDEPMIAAAVALGREVADRVVIVTAESLVEATLAVVPGDVEVIAEPVGKNTSPRSSSSTNPKPPYRRSANSPSSSSCMTPCASTRTPSSSSPPTLPSFSATPTPRSSPSTTANSTRSHTKKPHPWSSCSAS